MGLVTAQSLLAFVIVVHLEQQTSGLGFERAVMDAGWPARISRRMKRLAALAMGVITDDEISRHQIHFFPVVMDERRGGVNAGIKLQQARPAPHFSNLVEIACKNFLLDADRIAGSRVPTFLPVDGMKFEMRLIHRHRGSP